MVMIKHPDGSISYPHRGKPPPVPEGYERDPGDPFTIRPCFPDCKHRQIVGMLLPCGKVSNNPFCKLKGVTVNPLICLECDEILGD